MESFRLREADEFIKLGQILKAVGIADSGVEAKELISDGRVCVNGEIEEKRGRKLYPGDTVSYRERKIEIEK